MWSDNETSVDLLGCRHLVSAVLDIVNDDRLLPATLGVFGDWGSGKSSLIQMVRKGIEEDKETLVLTFNGWLFEGAEDAKTALMGTIVDEVTAKRKLTARGKELVLRLVGRLNLMKIAGAASRAAAGYALAGWHGAVAGTLPDAAAAGKALLDKAKDIDPAKLAEFLRDEDPGQQVRQSVREFRHDFEELLGETKLKRLVVIVDDLDRCDPNTIIETLEAIKLFLFVPRTAFIIGADERLIRYAVRRRFPELPGERAEVGRDYLEKLIQFPVRIPSMGRGETENYIKLLLAERCDLDEDAYASVCAAGVAADSRLEVRLDHETVAKALGKQPKTDLDEALALADRIGPVLAQGLAGNPRQCKRFLNTLVMRVRMAHARGVKLQRRVLAKLMLLEYLRPESFKDLARLQAEQNGKPNELAFAEVALSTPAEPEEDELPGDDLPATADGGTATRREKSVRRAPAKAETPASAALTTWSTDPWLTDWLRSEPQLAAEDLRPYFFFARDRLESVAGGAQRMSPQAQEVLARLLGQGEAERTIALKRASSLSAADAGAIFEALCGRARETESPSATDSPIVRLFQLAEHRPDLFGELTTFLRSLSHSAVPFALPPRWAQFANNHPDRVSHVIAILELWGAGTNANLKRTAATALQKLRK